MDFLELVKKRYSCRKYLTKPVSRESIQRCIEAARLAPSACNSQPWSFIVIDNAQLKGDIVNRAFSGIYAVNAFVKDAPVIVVVIRERSSYLAILGGYLRSVQYSLIDIGIACEHFIVQAQQEGLGTCWLGWFNEKAVKETLGIPKNKKVDVLISVGYPAQETIPVKNRKLPAEISEFR